MAARRVIVVGAGVGGLSAAIRLASRGFRVTIVEKLDRPGGKMGEVREAGFRWDTGPSVITMRHAFEQLFQEARRNPSTGSGRSLKDYLEFVPLNPITRYFWRDGATIDAVADEDAMCENIRRAFGPRDVDGYRKFMRYARRLYDIVSGPFLYRGKPSAKDLLRLPLADVLKIDALRTMHQAVSAHFTDPHLIQLFDRFATYNGSSPYQAPATLNVIAHVEMAQGAWYPRGGVYQVARAFERLARELGVEIRYNSPAQELCVHQAKMAGVRLTSGNEVSADAVICNVDVTHTHQTLLTTTGDRRSTMEASSVVNLPSSLEPSCSGFVLLLGVEGEHEALAHHNIFFSDDYRREFNDIFKRRIPPLDPTIYLCITSKTDPDHAPACCENWFTLINAPYLTEAYDWQQQRQPYATHIKRMLTRDLQPHDVLSDLESVIPAERIMTPLDLQNLYGGYRGAIYGFSSNTRTAAFMRPGNRAKDVKRLYFAGGSAHPGGGVPLVVLSGVAAAECVIQDLKD